MRSLSLTSFAGDGHAHSVTVKRVPWRARIPRLVAAPDEGRFDRGSWAVLALATIILLLSILLAGYRSTLPSDGWSYSGAWSDSGSLRLLFERNLRGAPSGLQHGDELLTVEGRPLDLIYAGARLSVAGATTLAERTDGALHCRACRP